MPGAFRWLRHIERPVHADVDSRERHHRRHNEKRDNRFPVDESEKEHRRRYVGRMARRKGERSLVALRDFRGRRHPPGRPVPEVNGAEDFAWPHAMNERFDQVARELVGRRYQGNQHKCSPPAL